MSLISDTPILAAAVVSSIVFVFLASATFYCLRELLSAWRTGSIQSKTGLVLRSSDVVTFQRLVGVTTFAVALCTLSLFAVTAGLMRHMFGISELGGGAALAVFTLVFLVALAAKFRR
jgi:hypothetical protein